MRTGSLMLRGEIRLTALEPSLVGEADKNRPAIVVSNDRANATAARLRQGPSGNRVRGPRPAGAWNVEVIMGAPCDKGPRRGRTAARTRAIVNIASISTARP